MLAIQFDLFVVGASPSGNFAVFVHVELDCFNNPTAEPIPGGKRKMVGQDCACKSFR